MDTTVELDYVKLGRSGYAYGDGTAKLELAGSRCNPHIYQVDGIDKKGNFLRRKLSEDSRSVSGGGNGFAHYSGLKDGLYYADGLLGTSNRICDYYYTLEDGNVCYLDKSEAIEYTREHFAADFAVFAAEQDRIKTVMEQAKKLVEEILEEREAFAGLEIDGIKATPEFYDFSNQDIVNRLSRGDTADDIVQSYYAPKHYVVFSPVFTKADTAEEAIKKARDIDEQRRAEKKAAVEKAKNAGLPELTGTPRQKAWAITIRDKFAESNPNDQRLITETTAKYWIEHRNRF